MSKEKSRQQRWQEKRRAEGKCTICGEPESATFKGKCERHRQQQITHQAKYRANRKKGKVDDE